MRIKTICKRYENTNKYEIIEHPTKYVDIYDEEDGTQTKWTYNLDISERGPISVEVIYPKGFECEEVE